MIPERRTDVKKAFILCLAFLLLPVFAAQAEEISEQHDDFPDAEEIPAQPDDPAAAGDWYADADGMPMRLRLNADGTFELSQPGEISNGSWEQEDGIIILDGAEAYPLELIGDDTLVPEGADLLFTRDEPETYIPEEPVPDAEPGWFAGYWESIYADVGGTPVPAWIIGDNTDVYFNGTLAVLGGKRFGDIYWNFAFADGAMSATLEDGRTVTFSFQQDSLLRMTITGSEEETVLWLTPAWSEVLDGDTESE